MGLAIPFESNSAIDAKKNAEAQLLVPEIEEESSLMGYINKCWSDAEQYKSTYITPRLLQCKRQRIGEYEPDKAAQIAANKGNCNTFFNLTASKCLSFESWLRDTFLPFADKPFKLSVTPIPKLPPLEEQRVIEDTVREFANNPSVFPQDVYEFAKTLYDKAMTALFDEAKDKVEHHDRKIADQCAEGGFMEALSDFFKDLSVYPSAILQGPIIQGKRKITFDSLGKSTVTTIPIPTWRCVSPFDFFPSPTARTPNDDYLFVQGTITPLALSAMRGVDGWDSDAIDTVLETHETTSNVALTGEAERADMENRDIHADTIGITYREFWGYVQGSLLKESGAKGIDSDIEYYDSKVITIGNTIVHASLNPSPLNERPFFIESFDRIDSTQGIWGEAFTERIKECQDGYNAAKRNMVDNLALGSGPQCLVDIYALASGEGLDMIPRRVWQYDGSKVPTTRDPIRFFNIDVQADQLLKIADSFEIDADNRSQIPKFAYGDSAIAGAGQTASGMAMLIRNMTKGIQRILFAIDLHIIRPTVRYMYIWNMLYTDDESIKGDADIVPQGVLAIMIKEQIQLQQQQFLSNTANQIDFQIMGMNGRKELLKQIASNLQLDVEKIVPEQQIEQWTRDSMNSQLEQSGNPLYQSEGAMASPVSQPSTGGVMNAEPNRSE